MAWCTNCGAADQRGAFCTSCGAAAADTAGMSSQPGSPIERTVLRSQLPSPPSAAWSQAGPEPTAPPRSAGNWPPPVTFERQIPPLKTAPRGSGTRRLWIIVAAVTIAVLVAAGAVVYLIRDEGSSQAEPPPAHTLSTSTVAATAPIKADGAAEPAPVTSTVVVTEVATVPELGQAQTPSPDEISLTSNTEAPMITTSPADPMGGPRADINCGTGYIVQIASELDQARFARRVAELRSAGQLPPGTKWADTSTSCQIFSAQVNVLVLYAGPFADPYQGCAARLAGAPDSFIKGASPDTSTQFISCLCRADVRSLTEISTIGQQGVWVGELQRVLGAKLNYDIGNINADSTTGDPGRWGIYTVETARAVSRFRSESGLPAIGVVDTSTWSALQQQSC